MFMIKSDKKLKGIVVGCGYFAQFHIEAWSRMPEVEILAICDHDIQKAQSTGEKYGIFGAYRTLEEALDRYQPDFVDIATPPPFHLDLSTLAAKNKCNIIVQKPLAPSYEDALKYKT
jgi:D-apiose dehydrogenase